MQSEWNIDMILNLVKAAALEGAREAMEDIIDTAIDQTPVKDGTLRRSAAVTEGGLPDETSVFEAAQSGSEMKNAFSGPIGAETAVYGSYNTPYALEEHEDLSLKHKEGNAKFLENALNSHRSSAVDVINEHISKSL